MGNYQYAIESTGSALLVDAAWDVEGILAYLRAKGLALAGGLYTHAHFDHVGGSRGGAGSTSLPGAAELRTSHGGNAATVPLWIGGKELEAAAAQSAVETSAWTALRDGDFVTTLGELTIVAIDTPGHTRGGVSFFARAAVAEERCGDGVLFTGDTLFPGSVGRTDLPGGSQDELLASLARIRQFPGGVVVFPGHNYGKTSRTTISHESTANSWMKAAADSFGSFPPPLPRGAMRTVSGEL